LKKLFFQTFCGGNFSVNALYSGTLCTKSNISPTKGCFMKINSYALLLTAGLLAFSSSSVMAEPTADAPTPPPVDGAATGGAGGPPPSGGPNGLEGKAKHEGMFMKADKDADGFLTKEEMLESHKEKIDQMFKNLDGDKDGKLSKDEMAKGREIMRAKMKDRWKNRDGQKEGSQPPEGEAPAKMGAP
jgi:hypothetical protein